MNLISRDSLQEELLMTRRTRAVTCLGLTAVCAALVIGALVLSVRDAAAQFTATWAPDERADLGVYGGWSFLVTHNGERPVELVLLVFRIRDGRVVDTHRSSSFRVERGRPFRLDERHFPAPRFSDAKVAREVFTAPAPVPVASAERDANVWWEIVQERAITDWGEFRVVDEWKQRDGLVLIVAPADARLQREAMAHPKLLRLEASR